MINLRNRGQSQVEYVVLIVIVLAAFLTIGTYFKRGVQGRWKEAVDDLGDQYDPRTTNTLIDHVMTAQTNTFIRTQEVAEGQYTNRWDVTVSSETKNGEMRVGDYTQ